MAMANFEKKGKTLTIQPQGRMDTARTPLPAQEVQAYMDGIENVAFDMTNVEYISSSGLRLLLLRK